MLVAENHVTPKWKNQLESLKFFYNFFRPCIERTEKGTSVNNKKNKKNGEMEI